MRVLIWQWGRRGAGPLVAVAMARQLAMLPGVETCLSLSTGAELLGLPGAPRNDIAVGTYEDRRGFVARILESPLLIRRMTKALRAAQVDVALCAMPAPLDFVMAAALRRAGIPYAVVVHDAQRHPGDTFPLQMALQRWLLRGASMLFALSTHVSAQLRARGFGGDFPLRLASLPPFVFWPPPPAVGAHDGPLRLLSFGRLLPYKGLDLLADALALLGARDDMVVRVVGSGPEGPELGRLRAIPNVTVENRWVPESELGELLGWADVLVLSHREASQSGVAAAAIAARRWVVSTRVGGLTEQLQGQDMAILCEPNAASLAAALADLPGQAAPPGVAPTAWGDTAEAMVAALREVVPGVPEQVTPPRHHDAKVA
jgi:glycosyltransferase involved in cell wall biosynthesis